MDTGLRYLAFSEDREEQLTSEEFMLTKIQSLAVTVGDTETLEKVQRRAIGMVSNLRGRNYKARLEEVGMLSLEERRVRGDMIATYKIMSGKDKVDPGLLFQRGGERQGPRTRGDARVHSIRQVGARLDIRRYFFSHRVVSLWNSLPNIIKKVETVLAFKIGYDKWVGKGVLGVGAGRR